MGCGNSTNTAAVQPLTPEELNGDEDEMGSKLGGRGDSAVSKGTADSGVVMENREIPALPGAVPTQLPPLTSGSSVRQDLLQRDGTALNRPQSSQILEELLSEGIISVGQSGEKSSGAGEAYSIMLDGGEDVKRRPPARLESLKAKKAESLYSREEIEEKIRLAEERRKLKEDELKTRLRSKSARVRAAAPTSSTEEDEDSPVTLVEPLQIPVGPHPTPAPRLHGQLPREAAGGGGEEEGARGAGGDSRASGEEMEGEDKRQGRMEGGESGDNRGEGAERGSEKGQEEEEVTRVEELQEGERLTSSEELESDSSFQQAEDKEETF
ncbi:stathmin domain-containing protein 1 isoform X2 [Mugil cephalus]|uniref:stathmin domain-containing protein 1 isoform X2 n=1 Tax=Mugil cephalus TaxID=48193 RepID=UPI001FB6A743|nr:stathmin domain-containing protein 1 isoform X2 [Mugil cephalus]